MRKHYIEYPSKNQYPQQIQQPYANQRQQPQISQPRQLKLPSSQPPIPTQLLAQLVSIPDNKFSQPVYNTQLHNFLTFILTPLDINDSQLRSGKAINEDAPIIIEEAIEEENPNQMENNDSSNSIKQTSSSIINQTQQSSTPNFPKMIALEKKIKQSR
jgi:hypothetical protein